MSQPSCVTLTNRTPCSTSRVASRQLCPSSSRLKQLGDRRRFATDVERLRARGDRIISIAFLPKRSRPSSTSPAASASRSAVSRSARNDSRRRNLSTVIPSASASPRISNGLPAVRHGRRLERRILDAQEAGIGIGVRNGDERRNVVGRRSLLRHHRAHRRKANRRIRLIAGEQELIGRKMVARRSG